MFKHQQVQAIREMRGKLWSPGRPSTAWREDRVRFWEAIALGCVERGRGGCDGCGIRGWDEVVPGGWRDAASHVGPGVGSLSVVR